MNGLEALATAGLPADCSNACLREYPCDQSWREVHGLLAEPLRLGSGSLWRRMLFELLPRFVNLSLGILARIDLSIYVIRYFIRMIKQCGHYRAVRNVSPQQFVDDPPYGMERSPLNSLFSPTRIIRSSLSSPSERAEDSACSSWASCCVETRPLWLWE